MDIGRTSRRKPTLVALVLSAFVFLFNYIFPAASYDEYAGDSGSSASYSDRLLGVAPHLRLRNGKTFFPSCCCECCGWVPSDLVDGDEEHGTYIGELESLRDSLTEFWSTYDGGQPFSEFLTPQGVLLVQSFMEDLQDLQDEITGLQLSDRIRVLSASLYNIRDIMSSLEAKLDDLRETTQGVARDSRVRLSATECHLLNDAPMFISRYIRKAPYTVRQFLLKVFRANTYSRLCCWKGCCGKCHASCYDSRKSCRRWAMAFQVFLGFGGLIFAYWAIFNSDDKLLKVCAVTTVFLIALAKIIEKYSCAEPLEPFSFADLENVYENVNSRNFVDLIEKLAAQGALTST